MDPTDRTEVKDGLRQRTCVLLATGFYSGYAPFVKGTFGSAVGALLYAAIYWNALLHGLVALLLLLLAFPLGAWAERYWGQKDPQYFVRDEIVGLLIGLLLIPSWPAWQTALVGFLLFRLFDGAKPFPIRRVEKLPGGIVLDDLLAGVFTNVALRILIWAA